MAETPFTAKIRKKCSYSEPIFIIKEFSKHKMILELTCSAAAA
jgi:hypothetical protein